MRRRHAWLGVALAVGALAPVACGGATMTPEPTERKIVELPPEASPAIADATIDAPDTSPPPIDGGLDVQAEADAPVCVTDLSNIGTGDFHIRFKLRTTQVGLTTLVYQRAICDHSEFWDVRLNIGGKVGIEVDNSGTHYTVVMSDRAINDGAFHTIAISRISKVLRLVIDGAPEGVATSAAVIGPLSPLGIASGDPCESVGESPLVGDLTDLCIEAE